MLYYAVEKLLQVHYYFTKSPGVYQHKKVAHLVQVRAGYEM